MLKKHKVLTGQGEEGNMTLIENLEKTNQQDALFW